VSPAGLAALRLLFVAVAMSPSFAVAQAPVIGVLGIGAPEDGVPFWDRVFGDGMRKAGYRPGQSVAITYAWARGDVQQYPRLAKEMLARRPAVIIAPCGPSLLAIRQISRTVPVIANCADEQNFAGEVASLSRPGGHTTGVTFLSPEAVAKRLEVIKLVLPRLSRLAILFQATDPLPTHWKELERLHPSFGLTLQRVAYEKPEELDDAFARMVRERAEALFVFPTNRIIADRQRIADLARKHRIPTVFEIAVHVDIGGFMSYGASVEEWMGVSIPAYVDKILRGTKAGDLPIVQPTQFELVVNLKTAREIGIAVPQALLLRANRVIE
jgi:putative tryptophan/tyrosine transport system substrate-binding protein